MRRVHEGDLAFCRLPGAPAVAERDPRSCPAARRGECCEGDADCAARARSYDLLVRKPDDVVLLLAPDGRIVDVNEQAADVYGVAREALLGRNLRDLRAPDAIPGAELELARVRRDGSARFETRHRRADGTLFPVQVSSRALTVRDRVYLQSIVRDVSARKAAEDAAALSARKFDAAFHAAGVPIVFFDAEGWILDHNAAAAELFARPGGLIGIRVTELCDRASAEHVEAALRARREGAAPEREVLERRVVRGDGSVRDVVVRTGLLRDAAGAVVSTIALVDDVTEQRRLRAQLLAAERMASLGTLSAGVAHEVNNPLAYVLANLRYAVEELGRAPERDLRAALVEALEGAQRVEAIVRDLRGFTRDDDERSSADLPEVARTAATLANHVVRHRARLTFALDGLPPVRCAPNRLGQVLLNLLVNAAHAIPAGAPDAHEIAISGSTAGDRVVVEVADTGAGISPEVRGRIFDPFFTTKPVGVGTGLGLFICQGIVTRAGGTIEARPREGGGTVFRVELAAAASGEARS